MNFNVTNFALLFILQRVLSTVLSQATLHVKLRVTRTAPSAMHCILTDDCHEPWLSSCPCHWQTPSDRHSISEHTSCPRQMVVQPASHSICSTALFGPLALFRLTTNIDECSEQLSGCEHGCNNSVGSFVCSCAQGFQLDSNNRTCVGGTQRQSVFEKFLLPRNHLPRGCHSLTLHTSVGGVSQPLTMLSTSPWYTRTSNTDVVVTDGVVMLAVGSASVPLSLEGVELDQSRSNSIIKQYKGRSFSDMVPIPTEVISETDCISGNLTYLDFYDFIQFGSFQNTIFNSLEATLPIWLSFGKANKIDRRKRELIQSDNLHLRKKRSILNVDNPDSRLILGSEIENINSCKGAPIKFDNIYSVFLLRSNFSVKIFDNTIFLNQFANGKEFCLINDISEPGSVFLLIPEESRDEFMKLDIFQTTHNATGILIKPRGIGLSLVKSVQVPSKHKDVTLWNGDHTFQYSIRREASVWLGGDVIYSSSDLKVSASIDTFLTVPDVQNMLIGITLQEWNLFITSKTSASYILTFELLEHTFELKFEDLLMINLDLYMSVGGSQPREWCGFSANPPGVFFSAKLRINPFKGVPILGDWIFYNEHNVYGFFMSNSENSINSSTDITNDMKKIKSAISRLHLRIESAIIRLSSSLMNSTNMLINNLSETMVRLENDIFEVLEKLSSDTNRMERTNKALTWIWKVFSDSEKLTLHILDNLEFDMENEIQDLDLY
ncbi:hypothetical protein FSP39_023628 [Pinctada imbricata]|uniref:EGF-like domain-containing protein n=1 Tax=Pinctada imbricata TaxID=66713 RepID=A0AA88YLZ4_PINIB|nr:hypothetical protein FSP39_023628 [Pinctada imbricata]